MTFRKLMVLAGIGGLVYAHRKHGGQMTLESFKQSGRDFLDAAKGRVDQVRSQAETRVHDAASKVAERTTAPEQSIGGDVSSGSYGAGSSGFGSGYNR